jgi:hypothetical protein
VLNVFILSEVLRSFIMLNIIILSVVM